MKLARRRKRMETTVELNITAFLNLMVILVPFLLITAVFSRMTVLELNLPALNAAQNPSEPEVTLQLQVAVTPEAIIVRDAVLGDLKTLPRTHADGSSFSDVGRELWKPLRETLLELKTRFPGVQNASLLLDREVDYRTMIAVMDHIRSADVVEAGSVETLPLFPQISVGDLSAVEVPTEAAEGAN